MNEIKTLELDKILFLLSDCCVSSSAKKAAEETVPFDSAEKCRQALRETDEAFVLYKKYSAPSFSEISDVSESV